MQKTSVKDWIIEETKQWLAINKPAGLIVEQNPFEPFNVEVEVFKYLESNTRNPFLGIVHRLDRVTSGILILAKKKSTLKQLNEQFQKKRIKKSYLALVENLPPVPKGKLEHWLYKNQKDKRAEVFMQAQGNSAKVALSYHLLKSSPIGHLLEVKPQTGKFHQIRAQLSAIGCPIKGDEKYGAKAWKNPKIIGLHASQLSFTNPVDGALIVLEAPLPDYFQ